MGKRTLLFAFLLLVAVLAALWLVPKIGGENPTDERAGANKAASLVDAYIRAHIADLSPQPPVLGGHFYVTTISFPAPKTAIVEYEDGHIALAAKALYSLAGNEVSIRSFTIFDPFMQTGTLIRNNPGLKTGVWYLNYDAPGSPGKLAELSFSGTIPPADNAAGSRVRITGMAENGVVTVSHLETIDTQPQ